MGELSEEEMKELGVTTKTVNMTPAEIKAADIILKKVLPDKTAVALAEPDELEDMSKDELIALLSNVVEENPVLAKISGIQSAVDKEKTVLTIEHDPETT